MFIVAHSHGGNVALAAINMGLGKTVDNLVTLGTPSRPGYRLLEPSTVRSWTNVFNSFDQVQTHGGGDYNSSLESGGAARTQPGAVNINWNIDLGPFGSHRGLTSSEAWRFTAPHLRVENQGLWPETNMRVANE
jgi:hypothetical protein